MTLLLSSFKFYNMSHKTAYHTCSDPDLSGLETQVNDFIKSLHKNEHHESIKVDNITTFTGKDSFMAAVTYSYVKKKRPEVEASSGLSEQENSQP